MAYRHFVIEAMILRRGVALERVVADRFDQESQARLVRETQAMARLSHPNVVAVYDVQVEGAIVTVVMEYGLPRAVPDNVTAEPAYAWLLRSPE